MLYIVNLSRKISDTSRNGSKMVGFQGGAWISANIDGIKQACKEELTLEEARSAPIHELFYNRKFNSSAPVITSAEVHMSLEEEEKVTPVDEDDMDSSMEVTHSTRQCYPQCYRLFYCIQAAVAVAIGGDDMSKEWAAQRVILLLKLIPDKPDLSKPLGMEQNIIQ